MRLANEANSVETRNKLVELARVWDEAALVEQQLANRLRADKAA